MESCRKPYLAKVSDIKKILKITSPTMTELCQSLEVGQQKTKTGKSKSLRNDEVRKIFESRGFEYPDKMEYISFMICKGGTGKSSSALFTATRLSQLGAKVLVVDCDPQGNLSAAFKTACDFNSSSSDTVFELDDETLVLSDVLNGEVEIVETLIEINEELHLIPSTPRNSKLDSIIAEKTKNHSKAFKNQLKKLEKYYDYCILDCSPAFSLANLSAISTSDKIIMPVNPDVFSLMTMHQTFDEIQDIVDSFNLDDKDVRIVLSKIDGREFTTNKDLLKELAETDIPIMGASISTSTDIKKCIQFGEDLFLKSSRAKDDYDLFTRELVGLDAFDKKRRKNSRKTGGSKK